MEKSFWTKIEQQDLNLFQVFKKALILKKMKSKKIEVGGVISNKKYESQEVYELIHIAKCFSELREKK